MGLMSTVVKAGIAKKVFDQLKKPENQAKIKGMVSSVASKRGKTSR